MTEYNKIKVLLSADSNFTTPENATGDSFHITVQFVKHFTDIREMSVRMYDSNYFFIGSDTVQMPVHKATSSCSFTIPTWRRCPSDFFHVYVYAEGVPRWFARIMYDTGYDDETGYRTNDWFETASNKSVTAKLENLEELAYESVFIRQIAPTEWWRTYQGLGIHNKAFTMFFLDKMRLFLSSDRHELWRSFPAFLVTGFDGFANRQLARDVLAPCWSEEEGYYLEFDELKDKFLNWDELIARLQQASVVTVDLGEIGNTSQKGMSRLSRLCKLVRQGCFTDIPFIFFANPALLFEVELECPAFRLLMRRESTFFLPMYDEFEDTISDPLEKMDQMKKEVKKINAPKKEDDDFSFFSDDDVSSFLEHADGELFNSSIATLSRGDCAADDPEEKDEADEQETENLEEQTDEADEAVENEEPVKPSAEERLQKMIGLGRVKLEVSDAKLMASFTRKRQSLGFDRAIGSRNHMLFLGNPGTGKTTVAKLIGEMYHEMGILSSGHTVVTDRSKLIGVFIGDAEKNTNQVIEEARGGVLFIDEAYTLAALSTDSNDTGRRVIDTLLTVLSEPNPDLIIIMAGYEDKMKNLLTFNPGLKDRFPLRMYFEDYSADELADMARRELTDRDFILTPAADSRMVQLIAAEVEKKDPYFGNGRWIHNLIEHGILKAMARRVMVMTLQDEDNLVYQLIQESDIIEAEKAQTDLMLPHTLTRHPIGFTA